MTGISLKALIGFVVICLFTIPDICSSAPPSISYVEGEVLVKFKNFAGLKSKSDISKTMNLEIKREYHIYSKGRHHRYALLSAKGLSSGNLTSKSNLSTQEMVRLLMKNPDVEAVAPNYYRYPTTMPNDTYFERQWGLHNTGQTGGPTDVDIKATQAWDIETDCSSVILASLDSGVDYSHVDLQQNMWVNPGEIPGNGLDDDNNGFVDDVHGIDTGENDSDPMDKDGHGTHTAGIMAGVGNNGIGVAGVCWDARIMAVKAEDSEGNFKDSDLIEGIDYVTMMKIDQGQNIVAINASWGSYAFNPILRDAIEAAGDAGIVFVASAGNQGLDTDDHPHYPSGFNLWNIVSVASSNDWDSKSDFSNHGTVSVDLAAPGEHIFSTMTGYHYNPAPGDIFFDDMESGSTHWFTSGTEATWAISSENAYGGSHAWNDSPNGDYQNVDTYLALNHDIDLTSYLETNIHLGFWAAYNFHYIYDRCKVEISSDGGTTWSVPPLAEFEDQHPEWTLYSYPIPDDYKTANFRMRFKMDTNSTGQADGIYLDNIGIGDVGDGPSDRYDSKDGTSMATPHVTGAAGLLSSDQEIASLASEYAAQQVVARLLNGVDQTTGLSGKVATGGRLNVNAVLQAGEQVFIKQATPSIGVAQGVPITIRGMGFGNTGGELVCKQGFSEVILEVSTWSDETLVFNMPSKDQVFFNLLKLFIRTDNGLESNFVTVDRNSQWVNADALPFSCWHSSLIVYNGLIYAIQGGRGIDTRGESAVYNPATGLWRSMAAMPEPIIERPEDAALGLTENGSPAILIFSNYLDDATGIYRLNLVTEKWDRIPFPEGFPTDGLYDLDVVSMLEITGENVCYLSGGRNSSVLWKYDPAANTLEQLGSFSVASSLQSHSSFYVDRIGTRGAVCVAGGLAGQNTQCFDIATGRFNPPDADLPPLPGTLKGAADLNNNGVLWLIGGRLNNHLTNSTYYLEPSATQWTKGPSLLFPLDRFEGAALDNTLYVAGGGLYDKPTWFTQVLRPVIQPQSFELDDDGDGDVDGLDLRVYVNTGVFTNMEAFAQAFGKTLP